MRFQDRRHEEVGIDLTPFIDVVFMLLLFFVVSTTLFKETTQLGVQLPKANAPKLSKAANRMEIGIDAQGIYHVDGKSIGSGNVRHLKAMMAAKLEKNKSSPVILVGDKAAPHQAVVGALEVAGELGITQVQIVARSHAKQDSAVMAENPPS